MCTLIVAHRALADTPLLVGNNRDERYERPAAPARWWRPEPGGPRIWAPQDLEAGGTWIGLSERGVFASLTNRFGASVQGAHRSRGEVVLEALMHPDPAAAAEVLADWDPTSLNPFHLVVADRDQAHLVWHDGQRLHHEALAPGVHVVTERSLGAADSAREDYVREQVDALLAAGALGPSALRELLGTRRGLGLDDVKVDVPPWNYGTRASTIIELGAAPEARELTFVDGGFPTVSRR